MSAIIYNQNKFLVFKGMHLEQTVEMTKPCLVRHMIDGYVFYEFEENFDCSLDNILSKRQKDDICEIALKNEELNKGVNESYLNSTDKRPWSPENNVNTFENSNGNIITKNFNELIVDLHDDDDLYFSKKDNEVVYEPEKVKYNNGNKDNHLNSNFFENKSSFMKYTKKIKKKNFSPLRIQAISPKKRLTKKVELSNHSQTLEMFKKCVYKTNNSSSSSVLKKNGSFSSNSVPCCSKNLKSNDNRFVKVERNQLKRLSSFLIENSNKNSVCKIQPAVDITKEVEKVDQPISKIIPNKESSKVDSNESSSDLNTTKINENTLNHSEHSSNVILDIDMKDIDSVHKHEYSFNDNPLVNEDKYISPTKTLECASSKQLEQNCDHGFEINIEDIDSVHKHENSFNDNSLVNKDKSISLSKTLECANSKQLEQNVSPKFEMNIDSVHKHENSINENMLINKDQKSSLDKTLECANSKKIEQNINPEFEYESSTSTCQPVHNSCYAPLSEWSVDQLHMYFYSLKGFEIIADKLKYEDIDGHVMKGMLMELDVKQFADEMNIKLGDAIRIFGRLKVLNTNIDS